MGFLKEFKEFAVKGNVMDLAIGVIIGGAFGTITKSLVDDVAMPIISSIIGNVDFSSAYTVLKGEVPANSTLEAARGIDGAVIFAWGNFLTVVINFILLAFVVFLLVKGINKLKREKPAEPEAPAAPTATETLLAEIRDELKKK